MSVLLADQVTPFGGDFGGDFDGVVRFSTGTGDLGFAGLPPGIGILNVPANEVCELPESLDLLLEAPCECPDASPPTEVGHASNSSELSVVMPEKPDVVDIAVYPFSKSN